jgi:hypothetical protein
LFLEIEGVDALCTVVGIKPVWNWQVFVTVQLLYCLVCSGARELLCQQYKFRIESLQLLFGISGIHFFGATYCENKCRYQQ